MSFERDVRNIASDRLQNNTLASYDSCLNDDVAAIGSTGDDAVFAYIAGGFLDAATNRLNGYLINGQYSFNQNDTYAMMELCSYEYATFGGCYWSVWQEWESSLIGFDRIERLLWPVHRS